jgi:tetratricopeptide (TPR) repeat protein
MSDSLQKAKSVLQQARDALGKRNELLRRNIKKNLHITESFIRAKKALESGEAEKALKIFDELDRSWKTREMRLKYYALTHEQLGNQEKARQYWQQIIDQYAEASHENPFFKQAEARLSTQ